MAEPERADRLVDVLKEIRDELRAVRVELAARGGDRMTGGVRTELVNRRRWRLPPLAAGGVAGLALVLGLALRDRPTPQPVTVAAAPQPSAPPATKPEAPPSIPGTLAMPSLAAIPAPAPVAAHVAVPVSKLPAAVPAPAPKQAQSLPAGAPAVTAVATPAKKRLKSDVAARPLVEAVSDDDGTIAFPPPPRRVRVHRLSYGPVGSEPAKL
jgi:hypothetical protein